MYDVRYPVSKVMTGMLRDEIVVHRPVDPEQGDIASRALPDELLPEYHIYHLCSLSPK